MEDSPSKRRKTSPTTSIPINAPTTPSRIPVPHQDVAKPSNRRPSFASPTKASIARHNPQLLDRLSSSGSERPAKKLDDLFAKYLGENKTGDRDQAGNSREEGSRHFLQQATTPEGNEETLQRPITPRARPIQAVERGLASRPNRMSRSPGEQPRSPTRLDTRKSFGEVLKDVANPFEKKGGLRRSPILSQAEAGLSTRSNEPVQEKINPFAKKTGLRRSLISSQSLAVTEQETGKSASQPEFETIQKSRLRRSPVLSQPIPTIDQTQGITENQRQVSLVRKSVLKGSPVVGPALTFAEPDDQAEEQAVFSPRKSALRRSPVIEVSRTVDVAEKKDTEIETPAEVVTTRRGLGSSLPIHSASTAEKGHVPVNSMQELVTTRAGALRRSPVVLQPANIEPPSTPTTATGPVPSLISRTAISIELSEPVAPVMDSPSPKEPLVVQTTESHQTNQQVEQPVYGPIPNQESSMMQAEDRSIMSDLQDNKPIVRPRVVLAMEPIVFDNIPKPNQAFPAPQLLPKLSSKLARSNQYHKYEEPELPPTPTQRGIPDPLVTTPPSGIHSTPSKRFRNKSMRGNLKSSPLKPRDAPSAGPSKEAMAEKQPKTKSTVKAAERPVGIRKSARFINPVDPHSVQKKAREDLFAELRQLQADIAVVNQENERLRLEQESGKFRAATAPNSEELLALLLRSTEHPSKPGPKQKSVLRSINAFLPFSSQRRPLPISIRDLEKPLPSYLPTYLQDPLPYLQAFSPLRFTSTITVVSSDQPSPDSVTSETEPLVTHNHLINVSHPSGLFAAQISLTVDASTLSIISIEIPKLDNSADEGLGLFIRETASKRGTFSRDVSVICWAMGRWTEVAIKRARLWCAVESELGSAEAREKSLPNLNRRRKRKRQGSPTLGEKDEDEDTNTYIWTRKQLLPKMSKTSMQITNSEIEILFEWKIGFDWTGEVRSCISVNSRLPKSWNQADDRHSLSKIPEMFNRLVKDKGPLNAVRAVVGLLMSNDSL